MEHITELCDVLQAWMTQSADSAEEHGSKMCGSRTQGNSLIHRWGWRPRAHCSAR